ncbi:MAG TPA: hypothetical protein VGD26_12650 [Chitinophagaceae bacterium]
MNDDTHKKYKEVTSYTPALTGLYRVEGAGQSFEVRLIGGKEYTLKEIKEIFESEKLKSSEKK